MMFKVLNRRGIDWSNFLLRQFCLSTRILKDNIYLMGPPGAGKTTVGRLLAGKLSRSVVDIDNDFLESYWGMTVAQKLAEVGPRRFVHEEGKALLNFDASNSIVSLSGSNPMFQEAMDYIRKHGLVVFMDVHNEDILERLERMKVDRIVGQTTGSSMADILKYRRQFYVKNYDLRILCERNESAEDISAKVLSELENFKNKSQYVSTRSILHINSQADNKSFTDVTIEGLAPDGGLYLPGGNIPKFSVKQFESMIHYSYQERAITILEKWIHPNDIPSSKLRQFINKAYDGESCFDCFNIVPVVHLLNNQYIMELFHGPSASFKDMALQLMPQFFEYSVSQKKASDNNRHLILVATSGDTGGAVLDGFSRHGEDTALIVLYPEDGVSSIQKQQMTSMQGSNVSVIGVKSDFDFCQSTIKRIFTDHFFIKKIREKYGFQLGAANSINFARLLPQVVYHISGYLDLVKTGVISTGDEIDLCIPTGNFGNILAAFYAKSMGLPIKQLICASNVNNILTEFINTGKYQMKGRKLIHTSSPAIDILKSSNLERFLYYKSGKDINKIAEFYENLDRKGSFEVSSQLLSRIQEDMVADWCSENDAMNMIQKTFQETGYLMDPHTAVGKTVADRFNCKDRPMIIASTAHCAKFADKVLTSLGYNVTSVLSNPAELLGKLESLNLKPRMHRDMSKLKYKERVHKNVCEASREAIMKEIEEFISTSV